MCRDFGENLIRILFDEIEDDALLLQEVEDVDQKLILIWRLKWCLRRHSILVSIERPLSEQSVKLEESMIELSEENSE